MKLAGCRRAPAVVGHARRRWLSQVRSSYWTSQTELQAVLLVNGEKQAFQHGIILLLTGLIFEKAPRKLGAEAKKKKFNAEIKHLRTFWGNADSKRA